MKARSAALALALAACAPARAPTGAPGDPTPPSSPAALPPAGPGTLRQDQFTISLRSGALLIKATPLEESVLRVAAPDTYHRLRALAESRRPEAERATGLASPLLLLVSFFSSDPDTPFQPEDLQVTQQGRVLRALGVLPVTPSWGTHRLRPQETQSAIYAFDPRLDLDQPFTVRYAFAESDEWGRILPLVQLERAKAASRSH